MCNHPVDYSQAVTTARQVISQKEIDDLDLPLEVDEQLSRIPQRWIEQHLDKRKGKI